MLAFKVTARDAEAKAVEAFFVEAEAEARKFYRFHFLLGYLT